MTENDKKLFAKMISKLMILTGQPEPSAKIIEIWFDFMKELSIETIGQGITKFLDDPEASQFQPTAAKIRAFSKSLSLEKYFEPTPEAIIAAAREPKTPLGVLARIKIGSWDLNNQDSYYLRQRAFEVIQDLPEWQARAVRMEFTQHEIRTMAKFKISPNQPFATGLPKPHQKLSSGAAIEGNA